MSRTLCQKSPMFLPKELYVLPKEPHILMTKYWTLTRDVRSKTLTECRARVGRHHVYVGIWIECGAFLMEYTSFDRKYSSFDRIYVSFEEYKSDFGDYSDFFRDCSSLLMKYTALSIQYTAVLIEHGALLSWQKYAYVMFCVWVRHAAHMDGSHPTYGWLMSCIWMRPATKMVCYQNVDTG